MPYRLQIFHDQDYYYAFVSGIADTAQLREIIDTPIPTRHTHVRTVARRQLGFRPARLEISTEPICFHRTDSDGKTRLHSLIYLPKYEMWSSSTLPLDSSVGNCGNRSVFTWSLF